MADAPESNTENTRSYQIRPFSSKDIPFMREIWNQVVVDGRAFPQENILASDAEAEEFFSSQTVTEVAVLADDVDSDDIGCGGVLGLYILHPNNVGRCGHIANASYAVAKTARGLRVGRSLVVHSLLRAKACGFRVMQFNAVVASNIAALHLYEKLGFTRLGAIPGGFRNIDGEYEDIYPHYYDLTELRSPYLE